MPHEVRIITETELRRAVRLDRDLVDVIEGAFAALHKGNVEMPPILSMEMPEVRGEVDVKTAFIPGFDGFAVKISPGFFGNPALGLPSLNGLMVLLSAKTGLVEAVFLDNGYLTDLRTAAAGAVAARHLAPAEVSIAGVIGTGAQAPLQMQAAHLVRPFDQGLVWGRDAAKAEICARDLEAMLGVPVTVAASPADLVAQCQLVVTATAARAPLVTADMLHSGLHITAMGSDQPGKSEIASDALAAADLYVCDQVSQCEQQGELRAALAEGLWTKGTPPDLGTVVTKATKGRRAETDITICDLTGTGAQDTAIACHVWKQNP
ncbi:MAG: cyclodeaminase, partial [Pseudomonadota bacterium]